MPEARVTRHERGPRGDLSRDVVVGAATRVLERDGMAAFSVRAVARELAVAPNALYTYAASRDRLLEAVADRTLERLDLSPLLAEPADGVVPRAPLVDFALGVLALLQAHPAIAQVLFEKSIAGPGAAALNEALIGAIHRCGPSVPASARVAHALMALVFGHAIIEISDAQRQDGGPPPDLDNLPLTLAAAVPVAEIPDVFRWSIDRLLAGCGC